MPLWSRLRGAAPGATWLPITGVDLGAGERANWRCCITSAAGPAVITLRVHAAARGADVPSLTAIIPSARGFFERELSEMFGVGSTGLRTRERLFLPDDWPDGVYPLRKDFEPGRAGLSGRGATWLDQRTARDTFIVPDRAAAPGAERAGHF